MLGTMKKKSILPPIFDFQRKTHSSRTLYMSFKMASFLIAFYYDAYFGLTNLTSFFKIIQTELFYSFKLIFTFEGELFLPKVA